MNEEYLARARAQVKDVRLFINGVSKRALQLSKGIASCNRLYRMTIVPTWILPAGKLPRGVKSYQAWMLKSSCPIVFHKSASS